MSQPSNPPTATLSITLRESWAETARRDWRCVCVHASLSESKIQTLVFQPTSQVVSNRAAAVPPLALRGSRRQTGSQGDAPSSFDIENMSDCGALHQAFCLHPSPL